MNDPNVDVRILQKAFNETSLELERLKFGDGNGTFNGMDGRVSRLEAHMEHVREDMSEIKADLKTVIARLTELPTKADLWAWKWQWTAIGLATMAVVIGGIIGGLSWIAPAPSQPTPIIVQVPK